MNCSCDIEKKDFVPNDQRKYLRCPACGATWWIETRDDFGCLIHGLHHKPPHYMPTGGKE